MRTIRILIVACAILSPLVVPQAANAAGAVCESNTTNKTHHVGQQRSSTGATAYGVKATITAERGALCASDLSTYNFNTAYAMVAQPYDPTDPDGIFGWAQVGYHRYATQYTYHFYQYRHGNPPPGAPTSDIHSEFFIGQVAGDVGYEYVVRYSDTCECIRMFIDGALVANTDFDPFFSWYGSGAWSYQLMAETRYKASDVPGSATDRTQIGNIRLWSSVNSYYAMPCGSLTSHNENSTRWSTRRPTCDSAEIWTL